MKKCNYVKEFEQTIYSFSRARSTWEIFNDFLYLTAAALASVVPVPEREEREQRYLAIINRYEKKEQELLVKLFVITVQALEEDRRQDFMGTIYHSLNLQQEQKGQFFTPYNISEMMAKILIDEEMLLGGIKKKGYASISDPACGSGAMLIAFANAAGKLNIDYQKNVLFEAQDIDRTAGLMCFIQLSLLGCPAVIIIGDSLLKPGMHPDNDIWYSPLYYMNHWRFQKTVEVEAAEEPEKKNVQVLPNVRYTEDIGGQLVLCLEEKLRSAS